MSTESSHSEVVGVVSQKGGCGKTTLATNLARALQLVGNNVSIIDADPQRTATNWADSQPDGYPIVVRHVEDDAPTALPLRKRVDVLSEKSDIAIVDGAAEIERGVRAIVRASDSILIPVQPSPADVWAAQTVVDAASRTDTPAAFVISRKIVGTNLAGDVVDTLEDLHLPILTPGTSQRVAYAEVLTKGQSVLDLSDAEKAKKEIQNIASELINFLQLNGSSNTLSTPHKDTSSTYS